MPNGARVDGVVKTVAALRRRATQYGTEKRIHAVVGYTQSYAIFVHENLTAFHKVGQAKFLEQPAREHAGKMAEIVANTLKAGKTLAQAELLAGLFLQRASMKLCPVDTGALRASAYTRLET